jgi:cytochrome c oxidase subunit 2
MLDNKFIFMELSMQDTVWIITLVLVALLAAVFLKVLWRASAPAAGSTADPSRYRAPLFWLLVVAGIGVTYGTLAEWPYGPGAAASGEPMTVTVTGSQWSWDINQTKLPVGKLIVFAVTSSDVNHGFGIYNPDLKMVTQVQAMPGYINKVYYTFSKAGTYKIMCLEYCSIAHHLMVADLTVGP